MNLKEHLNYSEEPNSKVVLSLLETSWERTSTLSIGFTSYYMAQQQSSRIIFAHKFLFTVRIWNCYYTYI